MKERGQGTGTGPGTGQGWLLNCAIAHQRLSNQRLVGSSLRDAAAVVSWFGAVQAQEYPLACWGLALRMRGSTTAAAIERAFDDGRILRTHLMRPTWHFVTSDDIGWMLTLTALRVRRSLGHTFRSYAINDSTCVKAIDTFQKVLEGGKSLTRAELGTELRRAGIIAKGITLALLTIYAELEGVLCSGPRAGTKLTYALLPERAATGRTLTADESIAELTLRYFRSHGPATIKDFVWWSGLTSRDAKKGLEIIRAHSAEIDGLTYWTAGGARSASTKTTIQMLPNYDEYLVAYRDRKAVPRRPVGPGGLQQAVIVNGEVTGRWRTRNETDTCAVSFDLYRRLTKVERVELDEAVDRYARFLERPVAVK